MKLSAALAYGVVFVASGCTLVLELVAGRLLAPSIGVSLYSWTAIIGVVLAGISLGNWLGGRLADRWASARTLALVLGLGGLAALAVVPLSGLAADRSLFRLDCPPDSAWCSPQLALELKIVALTAALFLAPGLILGMVTPLVIRLELTSVQTSGATVGQLYAAGTVGSIVGTFLTGFWLIATFGTRAIVLGVGLTLLGLGILVARAARLRGAGQVVTLVAGLAIGGLLLGAINQTGALSSGCYRETDYFCIKVYDQDHGGRVLRTLVLDHLIHSYTSIDNPSYYEYAYVKVYAEVTDYVARERPGYRALFIGGGGYTLPRGLETQYPAARIEVAEIDPGVTATAYEQMGVPADTRIITHTADARLVVAEAQGGPRYDLVFGDAFNDLSVPYHLTTREFDRQVRGLLADDGFYLVNVIDKLYGGQFLPSFVRAMKQVFPNVYVMSAGTPWLNSVSYANTYVVVGTPTPLNVERLQQVRGQGPSGSLVTNIMPSEQMEEWLQSAPGAILTDDFAPADNYLAPLFAERGF